MPSLLDLRRRIRAVKSTQQITKAMKTVSASKLRRAQDRVIAARPYARLMQRVLSSVAAQADPATHPLLAGPVNSDAPVLLLLITADKGLCGSFNSSLLREATSYCDRSDRNVSMGLVGRKGRDFFVRRNADVRFEEVNIAGGLQYAHAEAVAKVVIDEYTSGKASGVSLIYNEFKSVIQQQVVVKELLPLPKGDLDDGDSTEYLFEPSPDLILRDLLPQHIETQLFQALLESIAAEHAARMTAMDAAVRNAGEMIDSLTLHMNKVRQAAITRELIEVVSGADAL
tara:strand:+ start:45508 stop:46362 length:855 start_codon:yes stop_codon:yes gene_type:complete